MLDLHRLRNEIKAIVLRQWQQLDISADPLVWAWFVHAFSLEGLSNNPPFVEALRHVKLWLDSGDVWEGEGHLGSIGFFCSFLRQVGDETFKATSDRLVERVMEVRQRGLGKFSRLNDPDVVFGIALGVADRLSAETHHWLKEHCERNTRSGNRRRGYLFAAATHELHGTVPPLEFNVSDLQPYEVFVALWLAERYTGIIESAERRRGIWEAFEHIKDGLSFQMTENDTKSLYSASPIDIAMLYEALLLQTRGVDPVALFSNLPWHPEVRQASESLFMKGEYVMAVFQAGLLFVRAVKNRANHPLGKDGRPLDGGPLMSHVFRANAPILKFNDLKDQADRDEQRGLALIAEGIVSALRNPKGHVPHIAIKLGPYEALEQLAIISHLMRRLDMAKP